MGSFIQCRTVGRKQKVFNRGASQFFGGALRLCSGLDTTKLTKTLLIYSVSRLNLGGGALFGGLSPPKPPSGNGTDSVARSGHLYLEYAVYDITIDVIFMFSNQRFCEVC